MPSPTAVEFDSVAETDSQARETALACLRAGIRAAHPEQVVADAVELDGETLRIGEERYDLAAYDEVVVIGGGKAADGVADALEAILGSRLAAGAVVTTDPPERDGVVERLRGDHPVPSERGVEGARRVVELAREAGERTLVLAVITGGASALLPAPAEGISLADLQTTTDALLESGAEIGELNAVRKHLSALKGGRLAETAAPATVVTLAFSDVVGNDLSVIGSGPTSPDDSTFGEALDVLDRYGLDVPAAVRERLERGAGGDVGETPGPGDAVFDRVHTHVLADTYTALAAARDVARERGYETCVLSSRIRGEAREAAKSHVGIAEECLATGNPVEPPAVLLSGGEVTVTVSGDGAGGPNQEFALAAALELPRGVTLASVDTDGHDGSSDAAGALVDAATVDSVADARAALSNNDSGGYLAGRDALLRTGPTGTNVNDARVVVVEAPDEESS
jgi:hydroxypyruvate reductase